MVQAAAAEIPPGPFARLAGLCDPGTLTPCLHGGVVTATGSVAGRRIACYASDTARQAGAVGVLEADAVCALLEHAGRDALPVVAFVASAGARVQEGSPALDGFARIFRAQVGLHTLQVTVICGLSAGGGCYAPALGDLVVMTEGAAMFLTGPAIVAAALGERTTSDRLGGVRVHERTGLCDLVADGDAGACTLARRVLGAFAPGQSCAPERADPGAVLPARSRQVYDVRGVLGGIVDAGSLLELAPRWAPNMLAGLARLAGRPVGVIANQPRWLGGVLDAGACDKAARFVTLFDAQRLPLVVLVDTPGFMPGERQEQNAIIRRGARLLRAFVAASVPRVTVVLRKAHGGAYIAMNARALGADRVLVWTGAELGVMGSSAAVELLHGPALATAADGAHERERLERAYARKRLSAACALSGGSVDAVIAPRETRSRLLEALE